MHNSTGFINAVEIVCCVPVVLLIALAGSSRSQYFSPYYSGVGVYPASTFPLQQFPYPALSLYPNGNQNLDPRALVLLVMRNIQYEAPTNPSV